MQKNLHPYRFRGNNELLPKRWVFTDPPETPEQFDPAALNGLTNDALIKKINETGEDLGKKILIATDIVRRLKAEKDEKKEAPLITELKKLFKVIEDNDEYRAQGIELRNQAREHVESLAQKALLFLPSVGTIAASFSKLREQVSKFDFEKAINGGWEDLVKSFNSFLFSIKDYLPASIKALLGDYIPSAPEEKTSESSEEETTPKDYVELNPKIRSLLQTNIIAVPATLPEGYDKNFINYTLGGNTEWSVNYDGSIVKVKENGTYVKASPPNHSLPYYLAQHKEDIDKLTNDVPEGFNKADLARGLANLQKTENGKPFPVDVTTLISEKWDSYCNTKMADEFGTKTNLLNAIIQNGATTLAKFKTYQIPAPAPEPAAPASAD